MKRLCTVLLCAFCLSIALPAIAAPKVNIIYKQGKDKIMYRKNQNIDFRETSVNGEILKPQGSTFVSKGAKKFRSLIEYRSSFAKEMRKAAKKL